MIHVAIVEDDPEDTKMLRSYLEEFEREADERFSVAEFTDGLAFIGDYRSKYDLVLMDIDMPHLNGLTAAKKLRKVDENAVIIFVTNMAQYAIRGYEVDALDFLVKPVTQPQLYSKLRKALRKIKNAQNKKLFLCTDESVRCISVRDIRYIEVREHLLTYHLGGEDITVRGQMDKVESELADCHFYRIYKSYLVNLDYVVGVGATTVRVGEDDLCLSRARKKDFMQTLADYLGSAV